MGKQKLSATALVTAVAGLLSAVHRGEAAPPQSLPNNPFPPSFYGFNPGYYGPYYPGQYRYGNVQPQVYSNYSTPTFSGYGRIPPQGSGTPSSVSGSYNYRQYGSSGAFDAGSSSYPPSRGNYDYGLRNLTPPAPITPARDERTVLAEIYLSKPDAEVWVEGQKTSSTGIWRQFISPPLVRGSRYVYEFRARWVENGHEVNRTRQAEVRAGEQITVDFTKPAS
jgi:uncharacterized protein (TIGR03000 family)